MNRFILWLNRITSDVGCTSADARVLRQANLEFAIENQKLREALQDLCDEQNGPPLIRREMFWQASMEVARELLENKHSRIV